MDILSYDKNISNASNGAWYDVHVTTDTHSNSRKKIIFSILLLLAMFIVGVTGFKLISTERTVGEAIWVTVNILTTVGAINLELSPNEQIWASMLMVLGVLTVFYVGGNLVAFIVDGELRHMFGRRHLEKQISHLKNHVIVCGFGRMGEALCDRLHEQGHSFVVIDPDGDTKDRADAKGYLVIQGDAMVEQTLNEAQVHRAIGLSTCLHSDADNVFVTLTARELNEDLIIIARSENKETETKLKRAGVSRVICTPEHSANKAMQMLMHPAVEELVELAVSGDDLEVTKAQLVQLPKACGKTLRELALPKITGHIVVAMVKPDGSRTFNPPPDTQLLAGDELIVIGPIGGTTKLFDAFGVEGVHLV